MMLPEFSAALCRGLIEAGRDVRGINGGNPGFSAALCRGLIEAPSRRGRAPLRSPRFPRLYAAASLKRAALPGMWRGKSVFSAALCRGLIEAVQGSQQVSLLLCVFRGFMPRPH